MCVSCVLYGFSFVCVTVCERMHRFVFLCVFLCNMVSFSMYYIVIVWSRISMLSNVRLRARACVWIKHKL